MDVAPGITHLIFNIYSLDFNKLNWFSTFTRLFLDIFNIFDILNFLNIFNIFNIFNFLNIFNIFNTHSHTLTLHTLRLLDSHTLTLWHFDTLTLTLSHSHIFTL